MKRPFRMPVMYSPQHDAMVARNRFWIALRTLGIAQAALAETDSRDGVCRADAAALVAHLGRGPSRREWRAFYAGYRDFLSPSFGSPDCDECEEHVDHEEWADL